MFALPTAAMKMVVYNRRKRGGFDTGKNPSVDRDSSGITITLVTLIGNSTLLVPNDRLYTLVVAPTRCGDIYSLPVPVILVGGGMFSGGRQAPRCGMKELG
jgi:hypothetical protein